MERNKKIGVSITRRTLNGFSNISIDPLTISDLEDSELYRKDTPDCFAIGTVYSNNLHRTFIGIDNGVSGAITIISNNNEILLHEKTPVKKCLNYTKKKAFMNRVDFQKFMKLLINQGDTFCMIERPMVNPGRWNASVSALRCLEATEILLEELQIPYQFIDSKEWQKELLPSGLVKDELKIAADSVAKRLFPKQKIVNADSILIATYCLRKSTNRNLKPSKIK
jgi:hypothetical protein